MTMIEKIKNELLKRTNNGANDCTITMKIDNQEVTISPCTQCGQVEYWLTYGFTRNGFSTLDELAKYIANYENEKKAHNDEIDKITKYFNEKISQGKGDWDWYSDWHKDVFGFRPHGMVCGEYINPYIA